MAQWSHADRTIFAKIVYYGPAFGGKTTNLESLHRITDPSNNQELLSIDTSDDRTLFFDLLPFDLGEILGYQVALKVYTVPGQVRYDATRQVVLGGADAVVFVADSSAGRVEQNRWSIQNLRMNMRAKRLDASSVPVIYQLNKQDLPEAAPPEEVREWLGIAAGEGLPSVATEGKGVLETFMAAVTAMMEKLLAKADERTRKEIDPAQLRAQLDKAFAPHLERLRKRGMTGDGEGPAVNHIVGRSEDLLQDAIQTSVVLSEQLSVEKSRASRLNRESDAFRRLSDALISVGASFDREAIVGAALGPAAEILNAQALSLVRLDAAGEPIVDATWNGVDDPLLGFDEGRPALKRMIVAQRACVIDDLIKECGSPESPRRLYGLTAAVAVPVGPEGRYTLVAYGQGFEGGFTAHDIRFLSTLSGHLWVGLEKARMHEELAGHRDRLGHEVSQTNEELRRANENLRRADDLKDRFLSRLSEEIRRPITAILDAAFFIRDSKSKAAERAEMLEAIVASAQGAQELVQGVSRVVDLGRDGSPLEIGPADPRVLADDAIADSGHAGVSVKCKGRMTELQIDGEKIRLALANLLGNAFGSSAERPSVEIRIQPAKLRRDSVEVEALAFSVLDRGVTVSKAGRETLFAPLDESTGGETSRGLSLYEARLIAKRHDGVLDHLPRQGGGNEFRLTIPLKPTTRKAGRELTRA